MNRTGLGIVQQATAAILSIKKTHKKFANKKIINLRNLRSKNNSTGVNCSFG
jgi:hypothetical protein